MCNVSKITEGLCQVTLPNNVFYNPVQEFNRDLTLLCISLYTHRLKHSELFKDKRKVQQGFTLLDALSASGLRAVRFAKEIPNTFSKIYANDLSEAAAIKIRDNFIANQIDPNLYVISNEDAILYMLKNHTTYNEKLDIIDIDPYGSAVPFMDSAMRSIVDGGLLCVTCTDMGVLCGATGHKCYARYGSIPLHTKYAHEMSLRIVLHSLDSHANKYDKYIVPLLCLSVDFYVRLFVKVIESAKMLPFSPCKRSLIYHCNICHTFYSQPMGITSDYPGESNQKLKYKNAGPPNFTRCEICDGKLILGGPIWNGALHDKSFVKDLLNHLPKFDYLGTKDRILSFLTLANEEIDESIFYYKIDKLAQTLGTSVPKAILVKSAIINAGYKVSISHCDPGTIKTNTPPRILWDIFLALADREPNIRRSEIYQKISSHRSNFIPDFTINATATPQSIQMKLCRFPNLPPNWGPQTKASIVVKRQKTKNDANVNIVNSGPNINGELKN